MRRYFQFPLCALSFEADVRKRLDCITSFACAEVGKKQWEKFNPYERRLRRSHLPSRRICPGRIDLKSDYLKLVAGAELLRITMGNVERMRDDAARLWWFVWEFEKKYGPDAQVRICTDWLFEVRDGHGMSYEELAVLAAIYSKIGNRRGPVRILREEVWKRAHGFKSDRVFRAEMNGRIPLMTCRQVRSVIDRLHARKFFARVTFARRQTYYSHRLSATELADAVFQSKTRPHLARRASRTANEMLTRKIQTERQRLAAAVKLDVIRAAT
jgi:hypothetical protein